MLFRSTRSKEPERRESEFMRKMTMEAYCLESQRRMQAIRERPLELLHIELTSTSTEHPNKILQAFLVFLGRLTQGLIARMVGRFLLLIDKRDPAEWKEYVGTFPVQTILRRMLGARIVTNWGGV